MKEYQFLPGFLRIFYFAFHQLCNDLFTLPIRSLLILWSVIIVFCHHSLYLGFSSSESQTSTDRNSYNLQLGRHLGERVLVFSWSIPFLPPFLPFFILLLLLLFKSLLRQGIVLAFVAFSSLTGCQLRPCHFCYC